MDPENSEKLLNILRSTLYLVEHYGKPVEEAPALCDVERSILAAISQLEAANSLRTSLRHRAKTLANA